MRRHAWRVRAAAGLALALLFCAAPARAEERILKFASDIAVDPNGDVTVTETIKVEAEGINIRHGIFRDFPTVARTGSLGRKHVAFDVLDVTRDGAREPYGVDPIANGRRVKIGDADTFVTPGVHTYTLTYRTDRQIGFFDDVDELYWNVTGNYWAFTIESAEARIHLPPGGTIRQWQLFTGMTGERGKDATAEKINDRTLLFRTTRPLYSGEGLTVAVGFAKGAVAAPTRAQQKWLWLRDNAPAVAAAFGLIFLLTYYVIAWVRYGRDPDEGTIVPLFAPPNDLSPAAVRYVMRMGFDQKAFSAALVSMAVKGYLKIGEEDGDYVLSRAEKSAGEAGLDDGENAVAQVLFAGRSRIVLKQSNHSTIQHAIRQLSAALGRVQPRYFVTNRMWLFGGFALIVASAAAALFFAGGGEDVAGSFVIMAVWGAAFGFFGSQAWPMWQAAFSAPGFLGARLLGALFTTGFGLVFFGVMTVSLISVGQSAGLLPAMVLLGVQLVSALLFAHLLKAPTVEGAKARGAISGFRMFLDTAEKERLEILHPPKVTPELFEAFLPFAIALDVENAWGRRFEAEAREAGLEVTSSSYSPRWYSGSRSFSQLGSAGLASTLGASIASAATSPASSSSGGGGGSSGGGGGGGGGGGW